MKKIVFSLAILTIGFAARGQEASFQKYILSNVGWQESPSTKWSEVLNTPKGSLYYFGAQHFDNPKLQQFADIRANWQEFKPTIAFYEGPDRGIAETDTLTIRRFGESGYVRFLAKSAGIKTMSLEPPPIALYRYLCSTFKQDDVDLYMLAKEAMRLRTRKGMDRLQIEVELTRQLDMFSKMLGTNTAIGTIAQLSSSFTKKFGNTTSWWEAPESWFDPQNGEDRVTNRLALLSTSYRDIFMVELLSKHVNNGERVFAVVGRNHVPLQINAIKYLIGLPTQ